MNEEDIIKALVSLANINSGGDLEKGIIYINKLQTKAKQYYHNFITNK